MSDSGVAEKTFQRLPGVTEAACVIDASDRFPAAAEPKPWTREEAARFCMPSVKELPFVRLAEGQSVWGGCKGVDFWNVEATDDSQADFHRGRDYARQTIDAIRVDDARWAIESILSAIVKDAVARHKKGGKGSRTVLSPCAGGFLWELSKQVNAGLGVSSPRRGWPHKAEIVSLHDPVA
jgi:hypothetical protein